MCILFASRSRVSVSESSIVRPPPLTPFWTCLGTETTYWSPHQDDLAEFVLKRRAQLVMLVYISRQMSPDFGPLKCNLATFHNPPTTSSPSVCFIVVIVALIRIRYSLHHVLRPEQSTKCDFQALKPWGSIQRQQQLESSSFSSCFLLHLTFGTSSFLLLSFAPVVMRITMQTVSKRF